MVIESEAHPQTQSDGSMVDIVDHRVNWCNASCGISTVYGLRDVDGPLFVQGVFRPRRKGIDRSQREAFILFSDIDDSYKLSYGPSIAEYIKSNPNLGPITETPVRINPNTGHRIRAWLWAPDYSCAESWKLDPKLVHYSRRPTEQD